LWAAFITALSGCFSPWKGDKEATITINLGAGTSARAVAYPPDDEILPQLEHRVTLKGPTGTQDHTLSEGELNAAFSVAAGNWEITVEAWLDGKLYATGSGRVTVKAGQNNPVTIKMSRYITYSIAQTGGEDGEVDSTGIEFIFSADVDSLGLTAADITVTGVASKNDLTEFTKSELETIWTLEPITVNAAGMVTVTITKDGIDATEKHVMVYKKGEMAPIYGITLSQTEPYTFPVEANNGYEVTPLEVTVTNTGNQETGPLTATLTGTDSFQLSVTVLEGTDETIDQGTEVTIDSIPVDATKTFTVKPISELLPGTYTATVTVSGGNGITPQSFDVSFTVFDFGSTDDLEFELITDSGPNNNTYRVTGYTGTDAQVVIPDYYRELPEEEYLPVTEIGDLADEYGALLVFKHATFTSVTIGENVTSIGYYAFHYCQDLTSIIIPANVKTIGSFAFANSGLNDIDISEGVTSIAWQAFYETALNKVTIPASVTSIGGQAFANCTSLVEITFAAGSLLAKAGIGNEAFPYGATGTTVDGGDYLKGIYDGAGTYERTLGGSDWTKLGDVHITGMTNATAIENAIHEQLQIKQNVRVTGAVELTGGTDSLVLTIPAGKTVTWEANFTYDSNVMFEGGFEGSGDFELASDGSITSSANGYAITNGASFNGRIIIRGNVETTAPGGSCIGAQLNAAIIVDGGTITGSTGNSAITLSNTAKLAILGGTVTSSYSAGVVQAFGNNIIYVAGGTIAAGGIWQYGTATGYYGTVVSDKASFRTGQSSNTFTDSSDLLQGPPPGPDRWWE